MIRCWERGETLLCFHNQQNIIRFPVLEPNVSSRRRGKKWKLEIFSMPWNFHVCHLHQADERPSYSFHPIHWLVIEYEMVCERLGRALGRCRRRRKANCDLWWFGFDMCDDESRLCKTSLKMGQQKWGAFDSFVNLSSGCVRGLCAEVSTSFSSNLQQTL